VIERSRQAFFDIILGLGPSGDRKLPKALLRRKGPPHRGAQNMSVRRRRRIKTTGFRPPPPKKKKKGIGKGVIVAAAMAMLLAIGPVIGYQYIMDYISNLAKQVRVDIRDVRLTVYERRAALNVTLAVSNPTDFNVEIKGVTFDVSYAGEIVGTGRTVKEFLLKSKQTSEVWLLVMPKTGETFYTMLEGLTRGRIWIKVEGTIYATVNILGLFNYDVTRPISLYRPLEAELPVSMEVANYINMTKMEVLEPGTRVRIYIDVTNPFTDAAEPLPLNVTDVELSVYINGAFFGTGRLEEPIQIGPKETAEGRVLLNTTEEAIQQIVLMGLEGGNITILASGNVTVQLYDIELTRPFEHEITYDLGPGLPVEEFFNFNVLNMTGPWPYEKDGKVFYKIDTWVNVTLVAPKMPIEMSMSYNVTRFYMEIYDNKNRYVGWIELDEQHPIEASLANITRPAHVYVYIDQAIFDQTFGGGSYGGGGGGEELSVSFVPKNLSLVLQVYDVSIAIEKPEIEMGEFMGFEVTIEGVIFPLFIWRDTVSAELAITITNPSDYDIELLSVGGQPAIYFDLYCLEHKVYLGYGALMENVTIRAHGVKGVLIPVLITNMEHIRNAHWLGGLTLDITFLVKNGSVTIRLFDVILTISFEGVVPYG